MIHVAPSLAEILERFEALYSHVPLVYFDQNFTFCLQYRVKETFEVLGLFVVLESINKLRKRINNSL
jgi:hypothetical protein